MTIISSAQSVSVTIGNGAAETRVLRDVSLQLRAGELVLLMGPSGSGKTTLLSILAGLARPTSGTVELRGTPLSSLDEAGLAALRRRSVGFVFQTHHLFPALEARDNVALGFRFRGAPARDSLSLAERALADVGLGAKARRLPRELSTGEQQRVAVARALAGDPDILFGDEITAALDGKAALQVVELVRARLGPSRCALLVTHDARLEPLADRVVRLVDGAIVSGSAA